MGMFNTHFHEISLLTNMKDPKTRVLPELEMTKQEINADQDKISRLYRESYGDLFSFVLCRLSDRQEARDLVQEAYLRLLRVDRKDFIQQPRAYLYRIATNLVYEFRMKHKRGALGHATSAMAVDELVAADDPELEAERQAAMRKLKHVLDHQPRLYRAVLLMRKRDGMSHSEIAETLNVSVHTVHKYLTRAVEACRKAAIMDE